MIQIVLRDMDKDRVLSPRESKDYIKGMWLFNHGECCGLVDWQEMENWENEDSTICKSE